MNGWTIRLEQYITLVERFVVEIMLNLIEVKIYTNIYIYIYSKSLYTQNFISLQIYKTLVDSTLSYRGLGDHNG
jgi:hypothetical protein